MVAKAIVILSEACLTGRQAKDLDLRFFALRAQNDVKEAESTKLKVKNREVGHLKSSRSDTELLTFDLYF